MIPWFIIENLMTACSRLLIFIVLLNSCYFFAMYFYVQNWLHLNHRLSKKRRKSRVKLKVINCFNLKFHLWNIFWNVDFFFTNLKERKWLLLFYEKHFHFGFRNFSFLFNTITVVFLSFYHCCLKSISWYLYLFVYYVLQNQRLLGLSNHCLPTR